jgi:transposase
MDLAALRKTVDHLEFAGWVAGKRLLTASSDAGHAPIRVFAPDVEAAPDSIVYTNSYTAYDVLDVSEFHHHRIDHSDAYVLDRHNHINGIENFWNQAKRMLSRYNGIPKAHFPLFLKETEFRFNYGTPSQQLRTLKRGAKLKADQNPSGTAPRFSSPVTLCLRCHNRLVFFLSPRVVKGIPSIWGARGHNSASAYRRSCSDRFLLLRPPSPRRGVTVCFRGAW